MPVLQQRFQDKVRQAMACREINQSRLAELMGVTRAYVSQYVTGRNSPGFDVVERFADALGFEPWELLDETPIAEKIAS